MAKLQLPYDDPAAMERLKEEDEAERLKLNEAETKRIRGVVRGPTVELTPQGKEGLKMPKEDYPYLTSEDANFCRAFRFSEDAMLAHFGGLKGYAQFTLDRSTARKAGYDVPSLPNSLEAELPKMQLKEVTEVGWGKLAVSDMKERVGGCLAAIKADKQFTALRNKEVADKERRVKLDMEALRKQAAATFGVKSDSQTAKDWAEAEYERQAPSRGIT